MIILLDSEKAFEKNPTPIHDKNTDLGSERNFLHLLKSITRKQQQKLR